MNSVTEGRVRAFLLKMFNVSLAGQGIAPQDLPDDFDLLAENVIDSLGLIQMIAAVEEAFDVEIDFEKLDADEITLLGPFCRFVANESTSQDRRR